MGITAIDSALPTLSPLFDRLRELPYFRLYSVDMLASCEYLPQELFECYTESCEVYPVDDEDVPSDIRGADMDEHEFEMDGWARWDMPSEDYYDTEQFPEDYTGYDGAAVWTFIHDRIGFKGEGDLAADEYDADSWKADFNKAVSGLHAMVSAQVVKGMQEKLASGDGLDSDKYEWTDPAVEFRRRLSSVGETPEAVENMYFTAMLLLSGLGAARERLLEECAANNCDGEQAQTLRAILTHPLLDDPSVGAASRRFREHALRDSNHLWEARMRTRDLMRVMNCVQCNKCRLHGKISVLGISTALQLLVGHRGQGGDVAKIHRVELAALVSAAGKFFSGIDLCLKMQES